MKQTINFSQFHDAFQAIRPDNFSYDGLRALYDWIIDYEEDTGEEYDLDVIALCCEFSEYESAVDCVESYSLGAAADLPVFECPECYEVTYSNSPQCEEPGCAHLADDQDIEEFNNEREEKALEYLQENTIVIPFDSGIIIQDY